MSVTASPVAQPDHSSPLCPGDEHPLRPSTSQDLVLGLEVLNLSDEFLVRGRSNKLDQWVKEANHSRTIPLRLGRDEFLYTAGGA